MVEPPTASDRQHLLQEDADESPSPATAVRNRATQQRWTIWILLSLIAAFGVVAAIFGVKHWREGARPNDTSHKRVLVEAEHGAVASELGDCSYIGVDILKQGGNAVDAAISTALCIGTVNMFSSGIGGGGFMLIRHPNGTAHNINFRESAPAAATKKMYHGGEQKAKYGGLSVGVPGEIAGFEMAHKMYGSLPWSDLFYPIIKIAREGIPVPPELATRLQIFGQNFTNDATWAPVFAPTGKLLKEGDLLIRSNLSETLQLVSDAGARAFYEGPVAEAIVKHVRDNGGIMTMDDMREYEARAETPLRGWYHGREVLVPGAPSSGPVLLEALNILEGVDMRSLGYTGKGVHYLVEAMKYMSAGRTELGDPFDLLIDNQARVAEIQTKEFAQAVRANISEDTTHPWQYYNPKYELVEDHGTTHLSVVDIDGMSAAITTTINLIFGSGLHDPVTGIVLNDEQDDFAIPGVHNAFNLRPSIYNFIRPRKRSLSSQTPTIITHNGNVELVLGGSGGSRIVTAILDAIVKKYDWGFNLLDMVETPRVHHQLLPDVISAEDALSKDIKWGLEQRNHTIEPYPMGQPRSEIQAIQRLQNGKLLAMSDSRKNGIAAGY